MRSQSPLWPMIARHGDQLAAGQRLLGRRRWRPDRSASRAPPGSLRSRAGHRRSGRRRRRGRTSRWPPWRGRRPRGCGPANRRRGSWRCRSGTPSMQRLEMLLRLGRLLEMAQRDPAGKELGLGEGDALGQAVRHDDGIGIGGAAGGQQIARHLLALVPPGIVLVGDRLARAIALASSRLPVRRIHASARA